MLARRQKSVSKVCQQPHQIYIVWQGVTCCSQEGEKDLCWPPGAFASTGHSKEEKHKGYYCPSTSYSSFSKVCYTRSGSWSKHPSSLYSDWTFYPQSCLCRRWQHQIRMRNCVPWKLKELVTEKALHTGGDPEASFRAIPGRRRISLGISQRSPYLPPVSYVPLILWTPFFPAKPPIPMCFRRELEIGIYYHLKPLQ